MHIGGIETAHRAEPSLRRKPVAQIASSRAGQETHLYGGRVYKLFRMRSQWQMGSASWGQRRGAFSGLSGANNSSLTSLNTHEIYAGRHSPGSASPLRYASLHAAYTSLQSCPQGASLAPLLCRPSATGSRPDTAPLPRSVASQDACSNVPSCRRVARSKRLNTWQDVPQLC